MAEHTKGPWVNNCFLVSANNGADEICHTGGGRLRPVEQRGREAEANARLIAAAPCLLEAAKGILGILEGSHPDSVLLWKPYLDPLRAAIAKATNG